MLRDWPLVLGDAPRKRGESLPQRSKLSITDFGWNVGQSIEHHTLSFFLWFGFAHTYEGIQKRVFMSSSPTLNSSSVPSNQNHSSCPVLLSILPSSF